MSILSEEQVAGLWVKHGGPISQAAMAVAVSDAESHRDTDAVNKASGATGLMQIHPGHPRYKDPDENMKVAVTKWKERGWQPWSVCGNGAWSAGHPQCPKLAGKANAIARRIKAPRPGTSRTQMASLGLNDLTNPWANTLDKLTDGATGDAGEAIGDAVGSLNPLKGIEAVAGMIRAWIEFVASVVTKLADPNTWGDALKILAGLVMLYMGAKRTFELTK